MSYPSSFSSYHHATGQNPNHGYGYNISPIHAAALAMYPPNYSAGLYFYLLKSWKKEKKLNPILQNSATVKFILQHLPVKFDATVNVNWKNAHKLRTFRDLILNDLFHQK